LNVVVRGKLATTFLEDFRVEAFGFGASDSHRDCSPDCSPDVVSSLTNKSLTRYHIPFCSILRDPDVGGVCGNMLEITRTIKCHWKSQERV
jgi:hypothetical protein